jgi:hypothetical protein
VLGSACACVSSAVDAIYGTVGNLMTIRSAAACVPNTLPHLLLQLATLPVLKLRYDTADNLRLRKILDPSKPHHAALLAHMGSAAASSSAAGELTPPPCLTVLWRACCGPVRSSAGQQRDRQQQRGSCAARNISSTDCVSRCDV